MQVKCVHDPSIMLDSVYKRGTPYACPVCGCTVKLGKEHPECGPGCQLNDPVGSVPFPEYMG